jgi:cyanophycin synthetase
VEEIFGEFKAIDTALQRLSGGDLCLVLIDQVQESLDYIGSKARQGSS